MTQRILSYLNLFVIGTSTQRFKQKQNCFRHNGSSCLEAIFLQHNPRQWISSKQLVVLHTELSMFGKFSVYAWSHKPMNWSTTLIHHSFVQPLVVLHTQLSMFGKFSVYAWSHKPMNWSTTLIHHSFVQQLVVLHAKLSMFGIFLVHAWSQCEGLMKKILYFLWIV